MEQEMALLEPDGPVSSASTGTRPGGSLDGFDEETYASSPSVLETTRSGHRKGLQQYFTPPAVALFIQGVVNPHGHLRVFDPTAGDGSLLWPHLRRFGVEIHEPTVRSASRVAIGPSDTRHCAIQAQRAASWGDDETGGRDRGSQPICADQSYVVVRGDLQHVYPLLRVSGTRLSPVSG